MPPTSQPIGQIIRYRRQELGLTQADLAEQVGFLTQNKVSQVERGTLQLSAAQIVQIMDRLNQLEQESLVLDIDRQHRANRQSVAFPAPDPLPATMQAFFDPFLAHHSLTAARLAATLNYKESWFVHDFLGQAFDQENLALLAGDLAEHWPYTLYSVFGYRDKSRNPTDQPIVDDLFLTVLNHLVGQERTTLFARTLLRLTRPEWLGYASDLVQRYPQWAAQAKQAFEDDAELVIDDRGTLVSLLQLPDLNGSIWMPPLRPAQRIAVEAVCIALGIEAPEDYPPAPMLVRLLDPIARQPRKRENQQALAALQRLISEAVLPSYQLYRLQPAHHLLLLSYPQNSWLMKEPLPTLDISNGTVFRMLRKDRDAGNLPQHLDIMLISDTYGATLVDSQPQPLPSELDFDGEGRHAYTVAQVKSQLRRYPYEAVCVFIETRFITAIPDLSIMADYDLLICQGPTGYRHQALRNWLDAVSHPERPTKPDLLRAGQAVARLHETPTADEFRAINTALRKAKRGRRS